MLSRMCAVYLVKAIARSVNIRCTGVFDYCPKMIKSTDVFEMVNTLATKDVAPQRNDKNIIKLTAFSVI